jgi:hypothetical protein
MAIFIYVPAKDTEITEAIRKLRYALEPLSSPTSTEVTKGSKALDHAHTENPAMIYVLGHGNWGAGIGTHSTHMGARRLALALIDEGLRPEQTRLEIHLYACNTGVAGARVFGTRTPYVERLSNALAAHQFTNTLVFGYVGFLGLLSLQLFSEYKSGKKFMGEGGKLNNADFQVVYAVNNGVSQVSGGSWGMKSTLFWQRVRIARPKPRSK